MQRSFYATRIKPILDWFLAAALVALLAPVMAVVALTVRVRLGPPVIFRQVRIGRNGRPFVLYKFRGMTPDRRLRQVTFTGPERRVDHEPTHDPRHTKLGLFLRKWSIDELPQLWNVLRGEMSLVGPRPELPVVVDDYAPWEHERHVVKPGLTGMWQTTYRTCKPMRLHVHADVEYARKVSFLLDMKLLARTLPTALTSCRGWYESATGHCPHGTVSNRDELA